MVQSMWHAILLMWGLLQQGRTLLHARPPASFCKSRQSERGRLTTRQLLRKHGTRGFQSKKVATKHDSLELLDNFTGCPEAFFWERCPWRVQLTSSQGQNISVPELVSFVLGPCNETPMHRHLFFCHTGGHDLLFCRTNLDGVILKET